MSAEILANFIKRFAAGPQVRIENLRISGKAAVTVLFGASGAGKTTVLRCLAGLEQPDEGRIMFGEEIWSDSSANTFLAPRHRGVGFVPQDYALFPHLTVAHNVAYGLVGLHGAGRKARIDETLQRLGLAGLDRRLPRELSGGQQQRVALARAVASGPRLLLLDEPLSALDAPTRLRLRGELGHFLKQLEVPTVFVTHDRTEALALAEEVVVLHEGNIVQQGPVRDVFSRPANLEVAGIVAVETVQPGRVVGASAGLVTVVVGARNLVALAPGLPPSTTDVYVCIKAEDVILMKGDPAQSSPRNCLTGHVISLMPEGPMMRINLDCGFPLAALLTRQACDELSLAQGDRLSALIKAPQIHLIPRSA